MARCGGMCRAPPIHPAVTETAPDAFVCVQADTVTIPHTLP